MQIAAALLIVRIMVYVKLAGQIIKEKYMYIHPVVKM
jgi:hypothetical protein